MPQLKLTYFDFHGGRGEPTRLALHIGGIAFEDLRFGFADFPEIRKTAPLGQVPVLEVDGVRVTQSDAIARHAGNLAGLYPTDALQALLCDEVMQAVEDASVQVGASFGLTGDALKEARTKLVDGPLPKYLGWLQKQL
ncbi:MAG: glutathione S-transferase N-terminal domain-containing protein, partial [Burkholderiaceae bacterium]